MRRIWAGLLILTVAAALMLLRGEAKAQKADDKTDAKTTPKTAAEELGEITSQFNKDFSEVVSAFRSAKDAVTAAAEDPSSGQRGMVDTRERVLP